MRTLLTIAQQKAFLESHSELYTLSHKWSARGMGSSRIIDNAGNVLGKASGCGYDRFGKALGEAIQSMFKDELQRLGKRFCKEKRYSGGKASKVFYGMAMLPNGDVYLDGACGENCMLLILEAIGFSLYKVGMHKDTGNTGEVFYRLAPIGKYARYRIEQIKAA